MRFTKKLLVVAAISSFLGIASVIATPAKASAADCNRVGLGFSHTRSTWVANGYRFFIIQTGIEALNVSVQYDGSSTSRDANRIDSRTCTRGTYGGSTGGVANGDLVTLLTNQSDPGSTRTGSVFNWNDTAGGGTGFGWTRPNGIQLGYPDIVSTTQENPLTDPPTGNTDIAARFNRTKVCITTGEPAFTNVIPDPLFSVKNCNNYTAGQNYGRHAAAVDDSGRLVLGSQGVYKTVWCSSLDDGATQAGFENCGPDVQSLTRTQGSFVGTYAGGNGFLFRADQCILAALGSCAGNRWHKWYSTYGSAFLTTDITREAGTDYLERFYLHYKSHNTHTGGFAANNYFTLRYPLNKGECSYALSASNPAPGTIGVTATLTLRNTGTRPWRNGGREGFKIRQIIDGITSYIFLDSSGLVMGGQSHTQPITFDVPPGGMSSINWAFMQREGVIMSCSSNGFTVTPRANVSLIDSSGNPNTENPNRARFHNMGYDIIAPNSINGLNITRNYYFTDYETGSVTQLCGSPVVNNNVDGSPGGHTFPELLCSSLPAISAGDKVCVRISTNLGSGVVDASGNAVGSPASPAPVCETVVNKPYVALFNQDAIVGGGFGSENCTNPATINTFYDRSENIGSGVQFAAIALGQITQFMSASINGVAPARPMGLTFANSGLAAAQTTSPLLGGNFGGNNCIPDYWAGNTTATQTSPSSVFQFDNSADGSWRLTPSNTLKLSPGSGDPVSTIRNGKHLVLYVDGDVIVDDNISLANLNWTNENQIPSLYVIARGNIYISSDVSFLYGVFVAQRNEVTGNGGTIFTCTKDSDPYEYSFPSDNDVLLPDRECNNNKLSVSGTFIAQRVKLHRTINSIRNSLKPDNAFTDSAAESINLGPEFYLSRVCQDVPVACASVEPYDSIVSLPPIL